MTNQLKFCVDPGVSSLAWALGYNGVLRACGYYHLSKSLAEAAQQAAQLVHNYITKTGYERGTTSYLLVERPMFEKDRAINHQDVLNLSVIAGACVGAWSPNVFVEPMKWKGSVPKEQHQPRITGTLSHAETLVYTSMRTGKKEIDHNIVDAIGILLWAERRLKR